MKKNQLRDKKAPPIDPVLIEWLEYLFPDTCPAADVAESEKCALAGCQRVIRRLQRALQEQLEPPKE
jgi:hypothetical protein